jgi:hypothetical protein
MYIDNMCEEDKKIIMSQKVLITQLRQNLEELREPKGWFRSLRIKLWRFKKRQ